MREIMKLFRIIDTRPHISRKLLIRYSLEKANFRFIYV